jgi:hypothetical protein
VANTIHLRLDEGQTLELTSDQAHGLVGRLSEQSSFFGSISLASKLLIALSRQGTQEVLATPLEAAALRHAG